MTAAEQQHSDPFHDPNAPSLAEVLRRFEADPSNAPRRAGARSAVNTVSRLLHKSAEDIPAHRSFLMRQFKRFRHRPTGLASKSLSNCKSELRHLLHTVCGSARRSDFAPLSDEWGALRARASDRLAAYGLTRFMAFASAKGIAPEQVCDDVIAQFRSAVIACGELDEPERIVRTTVTLWNRLSSRTPSWPKIVLRVEPRERRSWTRPHSDFPGSFRGDVEQCIARLANADPESDDSLARACRPSTLISRRYQYYQAASALVMTGRPIESITGLKDLVTAEAFTAIMSHYRKRRGGTVNRTLREFAIALGSMARHYVHVDEATLRHIRRILVKYAGAEAPTVTRSRRRLEAFEDPKLLSAILHLPDRLLDEALDPRTQARRARRLAQIAVAVEMELLAPLRSANLAGINLNEHVRPIIVQGEKRWIITFEPDETKNRSPLTYELPAASVRKIERGMRLYSQPNGWLFPSRKGTHKHPDHFARQIKSEVERRLGIPFHIHMFRGLVASVLVKEHDNGFEMARAALGNRSERVVREHYTAMAERRLKEKGQEIIQKVRARTAPLVMMGPDRRLPARQS
jgi:integrase